MEARRPIFTIFPEELQTSRMRETHINKPVIPLTHLLFSRNDAEVFFMIELLYFPRIGKEFVRCICCMGSYSIP